MQINLANTRLFRGMEPSDIEEMLGCLHAKVHAFQKGEIIFPEGTATEQIGVVLSGRVIIEMGDVWGNNSVLSSIGPGGVFAEAYACVPGEPLMVNVTAAEDTRALLLNIRRVLEPCANVCPRHVRLVRNLLTLCSEKICSSPAGCCTPAPSPFESGCCPTFRSVSSAPAAIPLIFPTTASSWRIISA